MATMINYGELKPKHSRAIAALLTTSTIELAAKKAGVGFATLHRWMKDFDLFKAALSAAETDMVAQAAMSISAGAREAVAALRVIVLDPDSSRREKIWAASAILAHTGRIRLLGNLEAAINQLQQGDSDVKS